VLHADSMDDQKVSRNRCYGEMITDTRQMKNNKMLRYKRDTKDEIPLARSFTSKCPPPIVYVEMCPCKDSLLEVTPSHR